jgi:putative hydrolase of the HAD superfamily
MTRPHMPPNTLLSPLGGHLRDWNVAAREPLEERTSGRGLIVDLDDTLYAREEYVQSGLLAVARHVEETRSVSAPEAFRVMTSSRHESQGRELQTLCAHFGWDEAEVTELLAVYRAHRPCLRLPRDSSQVLSAVRRDGWRIAILTNGSPQVQRAKVAALGLGAYVDAVIYADEHATGGKPSALAFRAALNALTLPASRCVCAGDDPLRDIAGARALGMRTVWITPGFGIGQVASSPNVRLKGDARPSTAADAQIASIADLPTVLAHLLDMVGTDAA